LDHSTQIVLEANTLEYHPKEGSPRVVVESKRLSSGKTMLRRPVLSKAFNQRKLRPLKKKKGPEVIRRRQTQKFMSF
jgi:hypothetical protein